MPVARTHRESTDAAHSFTNLFIKIHPSSNLVWAV
jgi:hypothetical protein